MFCILVHDYTLYFTGSPCYNVSYYNYISIWPYYIVIHSTDNIVKWQWGGIDWLELLAGSMLHLQIYV